MRVRVLCMTRLVSIFVHCLPHAGAPTHGLTERHLLSGTTIITTYQSSLVSYKASDLGCHRHTLALMHSAHVLVAAVRAITTIGNVPPTHVTWVLRVVYQTQISTRMYRCLARRCLSILPSERLSCLMGSVGDGFRCPLCGRVDNGGYAPDGLGYPICTGVEDTDWSCLWDDVMTYAWVDSTHRHLLALRQVLRTRSAPEAGSTLARLAHQEEVTRHILEYAFGRDAEYEAHVA